MILIVFFIIHFYSNLCPTTTCHENFGFSSSSTLSATCEAMCPTNTNGHCPGPVAFIPRYPTERVNTCKPKSDHHHTPSSTMQYRRLPKMLAMAISVLFILLSAIRQLCDSNCNGYWSSVFNNATFIFNTSLEATTGRRKPATDIIGAIITVAVVCSMDWRFVWCACAQSTVKTLDPTELR